MRSHELLVAAGDWSFAVRVTVPASGGLRFGDWVRVQGRLVLRSSPREASLQLFLVDAGVERLGRSRRSELLQATLRRFARSADESRRLDWVAHVAVVGTQGHGLRDVIATLERAGLTYTLYEADFSDGVSIAAAIRRASDDGRVATLVTRGGGSRMELEPVNSVDVAAAARTSKAFTVLAIGHQSDVFDVECAFDRTFGTPSKGAGFLASLGRNPPAGSGADEDSAAAPHARVQAAPKRWPRSPRRRSPLLWGAVGLGLFGLGLHQGYLRGFARGVSAGEASCPTCSSPATPQPTNAPRRLPAKSEVSP
ncbi:MAG: exodeoxyribonuclease VII large subunit [Myxococcaceae bacterium]|nr:exodeoxyribonuclease VII large subunit [Myxococcaceae bacterium]